MKNVISKKFTTFFALGFLLIFPTVTMAWTFGSIAEKVVNLVALVFATAAVVYFLWYGIMFLMAAGDSSKVATARQGVLWGAVGVVVGAIAYGIITAVTSYFLT